MNPELKKKIVKSIVPEITKTEHAVMDPEEWKDRPGQRVVGQYHRKSQSEFQTDSQTKGGKSSEEKKSDMAHSLHTADHQSFTKRVLDVSMIEVMTFAVFRTLFKKNVRIPLKLEGAMDMDIAVENNDIIMNTNDVSFQPPQLQIWRFIFSYKNKPVLEYGRGIKRGIRVHYGHALVFLLAMWWGGRKTRKAQAKVATTVAMSIT